MKHIYSLTAYYRDDINKDIEQFIGAYLSESDALEAFENFKNYRLKFNCKNEITSKIEFISLDKKYVIDMFVKGDRKLKFFNSFSELIKMPEVNKHIIDLQFITLSIDPDTDLYLKRYKQYYLVAEFDNFKRNCTLGMLPYVDGLGLPNSDLQCFVEAYI